MENWITGIIILVSFSGKTPKSHFDQHFYQNMIEVKYLKYLIT